jgi:hypothetical protein
LRCRITGFLSEGINLGKLPVRDGGQGHLALDK